MKMRGVWDYLVKWSCICPFRAEREEYTSLRGWLTMSGKFFDCGRVRTSTHCTPLLPPQARSAFLEVQPISLSSPRPGRKFEELAGRKFSMDQICKNSLCKLCQSNVSFLNLLEKISINWNNQSKLQNSRSLQLHIYTYEDRDPCPS